MILRDGLAWSSGGGCGGGMATHFDSITVTTEELKTPSPIVVSIPLQAPVPDELFSFQLQYLKVNGRRPSGVGQSQISFAYYFFSYYLASSI